MSRWCPSAHPIAAHRGVLLAAHLIRYTKDNGGQSDGNLQKQQTEYRRAGGFWSFPRALLWLGLAMMLCLPGCGGCSKTPDADEQEKQQADEKARKKKKKEKEPFEAKRPAVMPSGKDSCRGLQAGPLDQPGLARRDGQSRRFPGRTANGDRRLRQTSKVPLIGCLTK